MTPAQLAARAADTEGEAYELLNLASHIRMSTPAPNLAQLSKDEGLPAVAVACALDMLAYATKFAKTPTAAANLGMALSQTKSAMVGARKGL